MVRDVFPGEERIAYPETDPLDSFGRARTAPPFAIFDSQFNYGLQPSLFQQQTIDGDISHVPSISTVRLSNGGVESGNSAIFQSRAYHRYLPGISHQIVWTCMFGDPVNGVIKTIGLFDAEDGIGFIQKESGIGILRRTSVSGSAVDNITPQSEWNLDKLDGTGQSRQALDLGNDNIFVIDFQWLGAGRVRYGFDFSGHITYCHQIQWANTEPNPFMRTANLPFRVEIENTDTADSEATFDFTCVAISSGGGSKPVGLTRSTNIIDFKQIAGDNVPVLSIRPRTSFNGLPHRGQVIPTSFQVASKEAPVAFVVIKGGTLTDAAFADVNPSDSSVQMDVAATAITGGVVVASGYLGAGVGMPAMGVVTHELENVILSNNIAGDETEILSLVISRADGVNSNCAGAFTWQELR